MQHENFVLLRKGEVVAPPDAHTLTMKMNVLLPTSL